MVKLGRLPCIILICVIYASTKSQKHDVELMLSMPKVSPRQNEAYRCTVGKVSVSRGFIVRFEALATQSVAHHMLLYGCKTPAFKKDVWDCKDTDLCKGREKILFAWAKNAPPLDLPAGVGFYVGSHTSIKYLVMQVHYAKKFDEKNASCPVCLEEFSLDLKVKKLPCFHRFHGACIDSWLSKHDSCPVCRKNLDGNVYAESS